MPRQNRVTPPGEIVAAPERGTFMGNRGCLHDAQEQIRRPWQLERWIVCVLAFKGRQRRVMTPGHYTELFFLDEATARAAGHRPCAECRRERLKTQRALYTLDLPTLERLRPELIVTQALCDVCAVAEAEVTAAACSSAATMPATTYSATWNRPGTTTGIRTSRRRVRTAGHKRTCAAPCSRTAPPKQRHSGGMHIQPHHARPALRRTDTNSNGSAYLLRNSLVISRVCRKNAFPYSVEGSISVPSCHSLKVVMSKNG